MPKRDKINVRVSVLKKLILADSDGVLSPEDIEDLNDCDYVKDIVGWLDCVVFGDYAECYEYLLELMMKKFIDK